MKAALITGAAQRIGGAIARELARDGWQLILHYATSEAEARSLHVELTQSGANVTLVRGDLASADQISGIVDDAFKAASGLQLLVNNASTFKSDTLGSASAAELQRCFAVNAVAPILLAQQFAERLPDGTDGCVVNIIDNRVFAPNPDYFSFGISKFALLGATRMMALALAPRVRVNGIAPGITLPSGPQSEAEFSVAHRINPLQRGCSAGEIAAAVSFIAASPAMTGSIITIDGGQTLANPGRDVAFVASTDDRSGGAT